MNKEIQRKDTSGNDHGRAGDLMADPVGSSSTHLYTGHEFLQY